jgi:hypothetical protein
MENSTLEFNAIKTIKLINKDVLLKNVFNSNNAEYNQMALLDKAKKGILNNDTLTSLNDIFETIIKHRDTYLSDYTKIVEGKKHPRRYGKVQIDRDITLQGGNATATQLTALSVNDLKNLFLTLENKVVADHYRNAGNFSDADGKLIRQAIRTLAKQLQPVLKKKK